jgi:predicted transcriptional regulator
MKRSKLEQYISTLKVLAHQGSLKISDVSNKANLNNKLAKENIQFLTKLGLVEEKLMDRRVTIFSITQNGITVLKYFKELPEVLPILEETGKGARHQKPYSF